MNNKKLNKILDLLLLILIAIILGIALAGYTRFMDTSVDHEVRTEIIATVQNKYTGFDDKNNKVYSTVLYEDNSGQIIINSTDDRLYFSNKKEISLIKINAYNKFNKLISVDYEYNL